MSHIQLFLLLMQEITYKQYISVTAMMKVLKLDEEVKLIVYFNKCYASKFYAGQYSIIPLWFKVVGDGYEEDYTQTVKDKLKGIQYINVTSKFNRHFETNESFRKLIILAKPKLYVARNMQYYDYLVESVKDKTLEIQLVQEHISEFKAKQAEQAEQADDYTDIV